MSGANIGTCAFADCTSLAAFTVNALNSVYSSLDGVLFNANQTVLTLYPYGKSGSYTIPASVTSIGRQSFSCIGVTDVMIPDSVTNIGDRAFVGCENLTNVTIGAGITIIGYDVFRSCGLTSVNIPDNVTFIGWLAFANCSLSNVIIGNGVTRIDNDAFMSCGGLTNIVIGNNVTSIGEGAFYECSLKKIIIPANVNSIEKQAFWDGLSTYWDGLSTGIYFEGNAPNVVSDIFEDDNDVTVYYLRGTTGWGQTFLGLPTAQWTPPSGTSPVVITAAASGITMTTATLQGLVNPNGLMSTAGFEYGSTVAYGSTVSVTLSPNNGSSVQSVCALLENLQPGAVYHYRLTATNSWGMRRGSDMTLVTTLYSCTTNNGTITLTGYIGEGGDVIIPSKINGLSVTGIDNYAFYTCPSLTSVTIPDSVTKIGEMSFFNCPQLTDIIVDSQNTVYSSLDGVLFNNNRTILIQYPIGRAGTYTIPGSVASIGENAFNECAGLTSITIPASVTNIDGFAFYCCSGLTNVTIMAGVKSIGEFAFCSCAILPSVTIPSNVTSISSSAVYECSKLTSIDVDDNNPVYSSLDGVLFYKGYAALIEYPVGKVGIYTIPNSVTKVDENAFSGCYSLTSLMIPSSVTNIGDGAFSCCWSLTNVCFKGNAPSLGSEVFYCDNVTVYHLLEAAGWPAVPDLWEGCPTALWSGALNQPPLVTKRSPATDPAPINEGASVTFSVTADDRADTNSVLRGMSNITWYVDGVMAMETRIGAPNAITSAFTFKTDTSTVQGAASKDISVRAVALDKQGGAAETNWTVRVNNLQSAQAISFPALPVKALGDPDFAPGATVKSGLTVTYTSSNESVALVFDGLIHVTGTGTVVITASQPGNFDFKAATPVKQTLTVKARLTASVSDGAGTVTGAGLYWPGTKVALTAKPNTGSTFLHWEDGSQTLSRSLVMPNSNTTVSAWFGLTTNIQPPVIVNPGIQRAIVGVPFALPLSITSDSLPTVTVTGLPAGLGYSAATMMIAGVPTVSVTNKSVTVKAVNVNKTPATQTFSMTVDPLPAWAVGTFNGAAGTDALRSGCASMSVTPVGGVSGKIALRGTNFSFSAASYSCRDGGGAFWLTATAKVSQAALPLTLSVCAPVITDTTGRVPPTLGKASGDLGADGWVLLYRNVWKDPGMTSVATNYTGYYTATLSGGSGFGSGYLLLTVDKAGGVKTAGKLADGTAVSLSGALILDEAGCVLTALQAVPATYMGGSLFGPAEWVEPAAGGRMFMRDYSGNSFLWESLSQQATGDHGAGFNRDLWLSGGWYDTVGNLYRYYSNSVLRACADARALVPELLVGTNRYGSVCWDTDGLVLTVVTNRSGVMTGLSAPKAGTPSKVGTNVYDYSSATNAVGLTVALTQATGVFKGSFKAWFDYAATHTSKPVSYEGVLTPESENTDDGIVGRGFFLWPDTAKYLNPQNKPVSYNFNWSYDFKILLSDSLRLFLSGPDNGRAVSLGAGSVLQVELPGNPSTGFSWEVDSYDPAVLTKVYEHYEPDSNEPGMTGGGGVYTFRFYAAAAGVSPLRLVYVGPPGPGFPADTFEVQTTVR